MSKADKQAEAAMERMWEVKPTLLKCSYNTGRRMQKQILKAPPEAVFEYARMTIQMSDQIPDHIILLCDKEGSVLRLVNLKRPESMLGVSNNINLKTH